MKEKVVHLLFLLESNVTFNSASSLSAVNQHLNVTRDNNKYYNLHIPNQQ